MPSELFRDINSAWQQLTERDKQANEAFAVRLRKRQELENEQKLETDAGLAKKRAEERSRSTQAQNIITGVFREIQENSDKVRLSPSTEIILKPYYGNANESGNDVTIELRWGKKLKLTSKEEAFVDKFNMKPMFSFLIPCPDSILDADYYFIPITVTGNEVGVDGYHMKAYKDPTESLVRAVSTQDFITDPRILTQAFAKALINPHVEQKILRKGYDYWKEKHYYVDHSNDPGFGVGPSI